MLKTPLRWLLAAFMVSAGILHFATPEPFIKIVPGFLPFPAALVYISGAAEILLGAGLIISKTKVLCAWGLIALFIAVYPANINMAINPIEIGNIPDVWWVHAIRLPLQFVLIAWAYWYTKPSSTQVTKEAEA